MSGRPWTTAELATLRTHWRTHTADQMAGMLPGRTRVAIANKISVLYTKGMRRKRAKGRYPRRLWTPQDTAQLIEAVLEGLAPRGLVRRLRRSEMSIKSQVAKLGGFQAIRDSAICAVYDMSTLLRLLDQPHHVVCYWRRQGWIPLQRRATPRSQRWAIEQDVLLGWIQDPRYWMLYDPAAITDPDWRDEALRARAAVPWRWVRLSDAIAARGYGPAVMATWVKRLRSATHMSNAWWVHDTEVAAFVPPCERRYQPATCGCCGRRWENDYARATHEGRNRKAAA